MSRGYGKVQREIIAALREHVAAHAGRDRGMPLADIVGSVYCFGLTGKPLSWYERTEIVAVRRALAGLVADGVVLDLGQLFGARRFHIHYNYYKR